MNEVKKRNLQTTEIAKSYEPTPEARAAREAVRSRKNKTPRVKVAVSKSEENGGPVVKVSFDRPDEGYGQYLLMKALGTIEPDFFHGILLHLAKAATQGDKVDEPAINFMIAVIKGIEPRDQLETMLAAQMAAVQMLTMDFACRLNSADNIPSRDSASNSFNKLARTFAAQMECLKRYRSSGEQKILVEHVTVNEGGKAIVGNVTHGGQGGSKKPETTS